MVKIVNILKATGLYAAIVFSLYVGDLFPSAEHLVSAGVSRSPESGKKQYGIEGSLSRHRGVETQPATQMLATKQSGLSVEYGYGGRSSSMPQLTVGGAGY